MPSLPVERILCPTDFSDYSTRSLRQAVDLIVMGTHGRAGFEHLLLGSVTEKLLWRAPCPILTVCHGQTPSAKRHLFRRIVCAADLTDDSVHTISFALSVAEENEARVILLHVLDGRLDTGAPRGQGPAPDRGSLRRDLEAFALERLRRAVPDEARDWCAVEERVAAGKPHGEIVRVAAEEGADLIVMGAHARGALDRLFFGSTASQVVREAGCPVLIVRPTEPRPPLEGDKTQVTGWTDIGPRASARGARPPQRVRGRTTSRGRNPRGSPRCPGSPGGEGQRRAA